MKTHVLRFNQVNRQIFEEIKSGKKKVETRAGSSKYSNIQKGDVLKFICGKNSFEKEVSKVINFKTISALLKKYKPEQINPTLTTKKETEEMYYSFPNYREKIKKFGLLAFELK